jgi:hypothetical protein
MSRQAGPRHWTRQPLWLGLVGVGLIVGGWKLTTFVPPSPGSERLAELRRMADDPELAARLDRAASREPPFRGPGRLAVLAGLALFVGAGVTMYRTPAEPADEADAETPTTSPTGAG